MTDHRLRCPNVAKGHSCSPCGELAAITHEILEAECHLANLNAKRVQIHGRMNQAHDSLVANLPVEVISRIFTEFVPANVDKYYSIPLNRRKNLGMELRTTPLLLASVCKTWRALAWSTPRLWSSISVNLSYVDDAVVKMLSEWLGRSGGLPLYICIYLDPEVDFDLHDKERISNIFAPYTHRWFYLELGTLPMFFPCIYSSITSASILNTLKMGMRSYRDRINLGMIANLRNIVLDILDFNTFTNINWERLTSVEGAFETVDTLFELFSNASSLTRCTFHIEQPPNFDPTRVTRDTILRHDHLTFLRITFWTETMDVALAWLKLPALKDLVVPTLSQVVVDLLRRSGCTLKTLDTYISPNDPEYEQRTIPFLEEIPSLVSLKLIDTYHTSQCRPVNPLLARLSDSTTIMNQKAGFLPNIRTLYISNTGASWNRILDLLLAYPADRTDTSTVGTDEAPESVRHVRPLSTIYIHSRRIKKLEDVLNLDVAYELERAIRGSSVQIVVETSDSDRRMPLLDSLQEFLYPPTEL